MQDAIYEGTLQTRKRITNILLKSNIKDGTLYTEKEKEGIYVWLQVTNGGIIYR